MSEISGIEYELLKAKAAAFDAIQAHGNAVENLRKTNDLLRKQQEFMAQYEEREKFVGKASAYLVEVAEMDDKAYAIAKEFGLIP